MKIHIITVGSPKLAYAKLGWEEYLRRLGHYHTVRITHLAERRSRMADFTVAVGSAYKVALVIEGQQFSSHQLAAFLDKRALAATEVCFMVGGPDGLPPEVIQTADLAWSFGTLTFPHDLAMVMLLETLYRSSTIQAGQPYHH